MAASIPVLRTLFRDLQTISRKYYGSSRRTQSGDTIHDVEACVPAEKTMTSSNNSPPRDSRDQILQRTEFGRDGGVLKGPGGKGLGEGDGHGCSIVAGASSKPRPSQYLA
jgi:hypothetical protein